MTGPDSGGKRGKTIRELARRPEALFVETLKLLLSSIGLFFRRGGLTRSASLAFTTLISLIPLLGLVVVLFKAFDGFDWLQVQLRPLLSQFLTPSGSESVSRVLFSVFDDLNLKTLGLFGTVFLFIGGYSLIASIEKDFNSIWKVRRHRSLLQRVTRYGMLMGLLPVLSGIAIYLSGQANVSSLLSTLPAWMKDGSGHLLPICVQFAGFWFLFWALPNTSVRPLPAAGGALFAALSWELAKFGFAFYTLRSSGYNLVYGSLAALPLLMVWVYLSWILTLVGAQMTFVLQNRHSLLRLRNYRSSVDLPPYLIAVAVMNEVACAFRQGAELTVDTLVESLDIPTDVLRPVLEVLEDQGELRRATREDDELLLPARPLEGLDMERLLRPFLPGPGELAAFLESPRLRGALQAMEENHEQWMRLLREHTFDKDLVNGN